MRLELHNLIIDHLAEAGFETDLWKHNESCSINGFDDHWEHRYVIIPGLFRLLIIENKFSSSIIKLRGIPGFEVTVPIENPDSLAIIEETLCSLYIWMKNINPKCVKELLDESQGFCGGIDIRSS